MPLMAILRNDLRTLVGSWLVRVWLAATAVLTLLLGAANWKEFPTPALAASILFPYLVFPWFLVVMVLGVNPVSGSRAEALADGILSRPVTRHEYLLATWLARVLVVLGTYLVVIVPAIWVVAVLDRPAAGDAVTFSGAAAAVGVVALVLVFQVSLAFLGGILLRKPLPTVVLLLVVWYPINGVLHAFKLEEFSPISLSQALPTLLGGPQSPSKEGPEARADGEDEEVVAQQIAQGLSFLTGNSQPPRVERKPGFFGSKDFGDFSLARVMLGYGIPTLLAIGLATVCFCRRDL
jgi:hypothetical protein